MNPQRIFDNGSRRFVGLCLNQQKREVKKAPFERLANEVRKFVYANPGLFCPSHRGELNHDQKLRNHGESRVLHHAESSTVLDLVARPLCRAARVWTPPSSGEDS